MDYRQVFSDEALREEFLDRFDEIAAAVAVRGGLEGLEGGPRLGSRAAEAVEQMAEGRWESDDPGLEAIILRFARPVHLVRRGTFEAVADGFPESKEITTRLEEARARLEAVIPSVGRIDLRNHRNDWIGTGWMVGPGLAITNRHVAQEFAEKNRGFAFRTISGKRIHALIDWHREYQQVEESRFRVTEVAWIEPDASLLDVALLRIAQTGEDGQPLPPAIRLVTENASGVGRWVAVIGYPGNDPRADPTDRQRIFDGVYDWKRLAAGQLTGIEAGVLVHHDATTLGGNSGSAVIDLATGNAVALHFAGRTGERNKAVHATELSKIIAKHAP